MDRPTLDAGRNLPPFPLTWTAEQIERATLKREYTFDEVADMISRGTKLIREERERLERKVNATPKQES